jgi:hypothetical protein
MNGMQSILVIALLVAGCDGSQSPESGDQAAGSGTATATATGGGDTCSYAWTYVSADEESLQGPDCSGRPGDALPCGPCDGSVPRCRVGHNRGCSGVSAGDPSLISSPYDGWLCVCAAGVWGCKVQSAAAAACPPQATDAGP